MIRGFIFYNQSCGGCSEADEAPLLTRSSTNLAMPPSLSNCASTRVLCLFSNPISTHPSVTVSFPLARAVTSCRRLSAVRTGSEGAKLGNEDSLRKPLLAQEEDSDLDEFEESEEEEEEEDAWEDQILEATVPLVGYVRMILHTDKYEDWEKLSPEHDKTIREKLLPFHPDYEEKIGPGIDYITVGLHPDFKRSRCLFVARKDRKMMDFSYWKCIKGLIRTEYPLYAERFIYRHFQPRRNTM